MTVNITLLPSGKVFEAQGTETLLESALRAGLPLRYQCNNGSCGQCQARLVEGELSEIMPHDYVFSSSQKENQNILLCRVKPASDLVIEAVESSGPEDIPEQCIETTVYKQEFIGSDICLLQLRTPRSQTLRFLAGQYVHLEIPGVEPRSKSIGSCPCNGMYLQFHIRRVPGDPFTDAVFAGLKAKSKLLLKGPYGHFTLDDTSRRPSILIAIGTGFAPMKSILEHAIALEKLQPFYLYWLEGKGERHYMENYCRSWVDVFEQFSYYAINLDESLSTLQDYGRLPAVLQDFTSNILEAHADIGNYDIYLNGPESTFSGMRQALFQAGVPADRIFIDSMKRY